jgi:hypothetical protein
MVDIPRNSLQSRHTDPSGVMRWPLQANGHMQRCMSGTFRRCFAEPRTVMLGAHSPRFQKARKGRARHKGGRAKRAGTSGFLADGIG